MCPCSRRDICLIIGISSLIFFSFRLLMSVTTQGNYVANYILSGMTFFGAIASACLVFGACQRQQAGIWAWIVIMIPVIITDIVVSVLEIGYLQSGHRRFVFYIFEISSIIFSFFLIVCLCITYSYIRQLRKGAADG